MKRLFFAVAAGLALLGLRPSEDRIWSAFPRSNPRPELESFFRACVDRGERVDHALRQIARIRRADQDRAGEIAARERLSVVAPSDWDNLQELARVYLWDGRPDQAFDAVERLILAVPNRREARVTAVELAEACGRPDVALPHAYWLVGRRMRHPALVRLFVAARSLEGILASTDVPLERARALVATGMREGQALAIEEYLEHVERKPDDLAARRELADVLSWNERPLDAAGQWEEIVRRSDDGDARRKLLSLYRAIHRIDLLLPHLPEGEERASVLTALGRIQEARDAWERLGRMDKVLELAIGAPLEDEELAVRERMAPTRENRERLAALYAWRRDFRRALALYEELDHERAVDLHLVLGDIPSAILTAERLGLHARLGDLYVQIGEYEKAIAAFRKIPGEERELARLLVLVGRPEEAVAILDAMTGQEYVRAELYVYAKRGDKAVALLRTLPGGELDLERVVRLARMADGPTAEALCRLVLDQAPDDVAALRLLADLHEWAGRSADLETVLRRLVALVPDDPGLLARLGLTARDRGMLERALALGAKDPRILRVLADIALAEGRKADAIALLRRYLELKPEDFEAQFALAELTRDPADYARTWALLPPDEMRIRARLLMREGRLAEAEALLKAAGDTEALADLYLRTNRLDEAEKLPLTPRQKADLAIRRGRFEEAIAILRTLDLKDPDIRRALAESLT
ncbi:MAG TPA: tetratricopeptide repeat protein, partial [Planctomycetota bacterium]|nr:tetratricopeptide repeat protein [Planctomycetota bacterium]